MTFSTTPERLAKMRAIYLARVVARHSLAAIATVLGEDVSRIQRILTEYLSYHADEHESLAAMIAGFGVARSTAGEREALITANERALAALAAVYGAPERVATLRSPPLSQIRPGDDLPWRAHVPKRLPPAALTAVAFGDPAPDYLARRAEAEARG